MIKRVFWSGKDQNIVYDDLSFQLDKLVDQSTTYTLCFDGDFKRFLTLFVASMQNNISVKVFDSPNFKTRIESLLEEDTQAELEAAFLKTDDVKWSFLRPNSDWSLTSYTSGTTGFPKKIIHKAESLLRNIKIDTEARCVWGLAYNPAHYGGLQVILQALVNQETLIQLFGLTSQEICDNIIDNSVTHLSATPSFFRNNILQSKEVFSSVVSVSCGGESFDQNLLDKMKAKFPNAVIRSIYASTEVGALFSAKNGLFKISSRLENLVKVSSSNELLVSQKLSNSGDVTINDGWYNTGDIIEFVDSSHFKIIGRKSNVINIGGYKVNLEEVEKELLKVPGITDAVVCAKKNSILGNILAAKVIVGSELSITDMEIEITNYLQDSLEDWQIPRLFKVVSEIDYTPSGKKVRKWKKQ